KITLLKIIIIIPIILIILKNPISIGLILVMQTLFIRIIKLYNEKSIIITIIIVIVLLLTIISTTKIVKLHEGPLRN
ncbi:NADH-ubiquinone oxidoreductase chain 6-like, partial [Homalodisca vitripennis]|uniref:NADH-ubiquinone oxidoreductase chain 6-like n=1 Tax=Homalodisca vitripennis TaxID=197043 RepID=UPI001EE9BA72